MLLRRSFSRAPVCADFFCSHRLNPKFYSAHPCSCCKELVAHRKRKPKMNFQSSVPVSGISQQSQPAMPTPGTVPVAVPVPVPQSIPSQFGSGSSASSGAGQFCSGTVSGQAAQPGPPGSQFVLSNSAAIRAEIQRFESVHPNIYAIYDLIERIDDLALQNQIREHVISIEGESGGGGVGVILCFLCRLVLLIHWKLEGGKGRWGVACVSVLSGVSSPFLLCPHCHDRIARCQHSHFEAGGVVGLIALLQEWITPPPKKIHRSAEKNTEMLSREKDNDIVISSQKWIVLLNGND